VGDQDQVDLVAGEGAAQYALPEVLEGVEEQFEVAEAVEEGFGGVLHLALDAHVGDHAYEFEQDEAVVEMGEGGGDGRDLFEPVYILHVWIGVEFVGLGLGGVFLHLNLKVQRSYNNYEGEDKLVECGCNLALGHRYGGVLYDLSVCVRVALSALQGAGG
jgi:hypothetical protein